MLSPSSMEDMMLSALKCMCSFIVLISKLMFWTRFIDGKIEASTDKVGCWRSHICPCRMELQWKILSCDLTVILWVFHSGFLLWCEFCSYSCILHNSLLLYGLPLFILYFQLILAIFFNLNIEKDIARSSLPHSFLKDVCSFLRPW